MNHSENLLVLLVTMLQVLYAFGVMFIACELSQRLNIAFNDCNDIIVQFKWYLLPAEIQRLLPLIIHFSQRPVEVKCFGSTTCDRETFKYVSKIDPKVGCVCGGSA